MLRGRRMQPGGAIVERVVIFMGMRDQFRKVVDTDERRSKPASAAQSLRHLLDRRSIYFTVCAAGLCVCALTIASAAYLLLRDDLLASLIERQTQAQYAYEDRIAALRLRLDQVASRQFIDQDGVEGRVQKLVLRQAQLETRAAVVAQLVERAVSREAPLLAGVSSRAAEPRAAGAPLRPAPAPLARNEPPLVEDLGAPSKPQPDDMGLRFDHDQPAEPPQKKAGEGVPFRASSTQSTSVGLLAGAADPGLSIENRLQHLALSLDLAESDQARRLKAIVQPTLAEAGRLRRAFDVAGLAAERYAQRRAKAGLGGPFIPVAPQAAFERELQNAQNAVATLDLLRRALPSAPLRQPVAGALQMTSTFGYRTDPFLGRPALHSGVDLREDYGAPVKATAGGTVVSAGSSGGYGNMVEIDHGGGVATRYAHLSAILAAPGQRVAAGAVVGRVGSTGRSTGPHLHYEVRLDGEPVDPARFLKAASVLATAAP